MGNGKRETIQALGIRCRSKDVGKREGERTGEEPGGNRKHTEETKEKMRIFHQTKKPQLGEKNSQYGTCWIYKIDENNKPINIKIKKEKLDEYLNDGWIKGRKIKC